MISVRAGEVLVRVGQHFTQRTETRCVTSKSQTTQYSDWQHESGYSVKAERRRLRTQASGTNVGLGSQFWFVV